MLRPKRIINELYRSGRLHSVHDTHVPLQNLRDLAELYRDQGEYIQAEQFYQRALATSEQELGVAKTSSHQHPRELCSPLATR